MELHIIGVFDTPAPARARPLRLLLCALLLPCGSFRNAIDQGRRAFYLATVAFVASKAEGLDRAERAPSAVEHIYPVFKFEFAL